MMAAIVEPTTDQLEELVAPYLAIQPEGLCFAIGYASPSFQSQPGRLFFAGKIKNQVERHIVLDGDTPFELASVSKTFTATLYALLIRQTSSTLTLGDVIYPCGPLKLSSILAPIRLDDLMNYTSGLPQDNSGGPLSFPKYPPQPYGVPALQSYLREPRFKPSHPGIAFSYSNLGFAIMASVLETFGGYLTPPIASFPDLARTQLFEPLGLNAMFVEGISLELFPLGYNYDYLPEPSFSPIAAGWPYFPAYYGAGGVVASPNDMMKWLLFNMGMVQSPLSSLLPALLTPSTTVVSDNNELGLSWFYYKGNNNFPATYWKNGELDGTQTYITFLPSGQLGSVPSQAGVFVLTNASGIADRYGYDATTVLANDILLIMRGQSPLSDKSAYPGRQRRPPGTPGRRGSLT